MHVLNKSVVCFTFCSLLGNLETENREGLHVGKVSQMDDSYSRQPRVAYP